MRHSPINATAGESAGAADSKPCQSGIRRGGEPGHAIDDRADSGSSSDPGTYTDRGERAEAEAFRRDGSYSAGEFAGGGVTEDG